MKQEEKKKIMEKRVRERPKSKQNKKNQPEI